MQLFDASVYGNSPVDKNPFIRYSSSYQLSFLHSPVIRAASEKLAALKSSSTSSPSASPEKPQSSASPGLPSASTEVLEAQRKRFEELKVCDCNHTI